MKALTKDDPPHVLAMNFQTWTDNYVAAHGTDRVKRHEKWRHKKIKVALRGETDDKCAYCEAHSSHVSYPHVEHMIPKSVHPELAHEWTNLTWACALCNISKDAAYHPTDGVLNPYVDDISAHLEFHGDLVDCPLGDVRGQITIRACDLNRYELVRARAARLLAMRQMAENWNNLSGVSREVMASAIRLEASRGEFTSHVYEYLRRIGFPIDG